MEHLSSFPVDDHKIALVRQPLVGTVQCTIRDDKLFYSSKFNA